MRALYFVLASLWGFVIGSAAILAGLALLGYRLPLDGAALAVLLVAVVLALLGGVIASAAYRDAASRFR